MMRIIYIMSIKPQKFLVGSDDNGRRLDRIIRILLPGFSLSRIYKLFRNGDVRIGNRKVKPEYQVAAGENIQVFCNDISDKTLKKAVKTISESDYNAFSDMILFQNDDLVLINKPRGLLTHGDDGVDALAAGYFRDISSQSLAFTPAPLHRLDRNTSGVLAISASIEGARQFSASINAGDIRKKYLALLEGRLEKSQKWSDVLVRDSSSKKTSVSSSEEGLSATCLMEPLLSDGFFTLASIQLETGRTHQIRVQCAAHGFPLRGDLKYGSIDTESYYILHARTMKFSANFKIAVPVIIEAPLPTESYRKLARLFGTKELENALNLLDYKEKT